MITRHLSTRWWSYAQVADAVTKLREICMASLSARISGTACSTSGKKPFASAGEGAVALSDRAAR